MEEGHQASSGPGLVPDPLAIQPHWWNSLFEHLGLEGRVASLTAQPIGTGQIGANVRFTFTFETPPTDATPATLVGKFPSDDPASIATARGMGHYVREVKFYRTFDEVAQKIAPRALYTALDEDSHRFVLIMEDMSPASQGDQLGGCSADDAALALSYAARLHGAHWNDDGLDELDWLQGSQSAPEEMLTPEQVAGLWYGFKDRYADHLTPDVARVGDAYAEALPQWSDTYDGPRVLSHGDYRLDNMLFGKSADQPLAIVDWQTAGVRAPALDVAYFLGAGLRQADLPAHERPLLDHYLTALQEEGVQDYTYEDLWRDYRWFTFYGMSVAFGAAMLVKRTERGDQMFLAMLRRHAGQAIRSRAVDLL